MSRETRRETVAPECNHKCNSIDSKRCKVRDVGRTLFCSLDKGHKGNHIACNIHRHGLATWPQEITDVPDVIRNQRQLNIELRQELAETKAKLEIAQKPYPCGVCTGEGTLASGRPCICGGVGTQAAELQGFREELLIARAKLEKAEILLKKYDIKKKLKYKWSEPVPLQSKKND